MGKFQADLTQLLELCRAALLETTPSVVVHADLNDLRKNKLPDSLGTSPINLYAIWSRQKGSDSWALQYIGQRSVKNGWERIRQHLFHTPAGTESKLHRVREALNAGQEFGVTAILVEPDYLRLSIEDELIRQTTRQAGTLPWNKRSRAKVRGNGP